jgi:uncharacterized protein YkwD
MQFFPSTSLRDWRFFVVLTALVGLQACGGGGDATPVPTPFDSANLPPPVVQASAPAPVEPAPAPVEPALAPVEPAPAPVELTLAPAAPAAPAGPTLAPAANSLILLDATTSCSIPDLRENVLRQINAARASGRTCGGEALPPTGALVWNDILFSASARHSLDMAERNYFAHQSPEGIDSAQRVSAEGYGWSAVGENIAAGYGSSDAVLAGWLASEGHCRNIMQPVFADVALACAFQPGTVWGTYWTMELGRR